MAEINRNANPPKAKQPKSYQEYLKDLDLLLKRNTGKGLFVGEDVSSNTPMYLPGKVIDPSGIGAVAPSVKEYGDGMTEQDVASKGVAADVLGDEEPMTALDYLEQWTQDYQDMTPTIEGIGSSADGGIISTDGNIYYSDGTVRQGSPDAYAVASLPNGGLRYSDGSTREQAPYAIASMGSDEAGTPLLLYSDGSVRYGASTMDQGDSGIEGLIYGIFGQERPVTQEYGNINPIEPTTGNVNLGTDIRTRDLTDKSYKIPVNAEVVEVYMDDGTRFGEKSGHKGYGNSILVKLPSGEYLRFSHMDRMANVKPGDTISAGQIIGTAGTTGNTYGEHLDLEYYNKQGQTADPSEFKGFPKDEKVGKVVENYQRPQPNTQSAQEQVAQAVQNIPQTIKQVTQPGSIQRQAAGQTVAEASPIKTEFGLSETIASGPEAGREARVESLQSSSKQYNPFRQLAGNITERVGDVLGIPEGVMSEAIAGGPTKRTNVALASEIGVNKSQEVPGIRQNIKDIGTEIKQSAEDALSKAGEGVSNLATGAVSSLENVFKPKQEQVKRAVGDVKGTADPAQSGQFSSVMDTAASMANLPKNDIRDPFFKMGGADMFRSFLSKGAESNPALSLETFTPDFYKDLSNISSVFGGSKDLSPAVQKYIEFEKQKYPMMSRMDGGEGYDQSEVDEYNRQVDAYNNSLNQYFGSILGSVVASPSIFTPRAAGSAKNIFSAPSKVNAPIMSKAPVASFSAPQPSAKPVAASFSLPAATASYAGRPVTVASKAKPVVSAPKTASQAIMSTPASRANTSYKGTSIYIAPKAATTPTQSKPTNVFKQASSAVKNFVSNVFRKK